MNEFTVKIYIEKNNCESIQGMQSWLKRNKIPHGPTTKLYKTDRCTHSTSVYGWVFSFKNEGDAMGFKLACI